MEWNRLDLTIGVVNLVLLAMIALVIAWRPAWNRNPELPPVESESSWVPIRITFDEPVVQTSPLPTTANLLLVISHGVAHNIS